MKKKNLNDFSKWLQYNKEMKTENDGNLCHNCGEMKVNIMTQGLVLRWKVKVMTY